MNEKNIYDLVIIGSGPAGLAAAIYATRAQLNALVLEKEVMSGGQVLNTYEVDNYPGLPGINGFDLGMKFREHADALGAQFAEDEVLSISTLGESDSKTQEGEQEEKELQAAELLEPSSVGYRIVGENDSYDTKSIIIASGASHRKLGVAGEERLTGHGVSYCATCDGAFFKGKTTAVVGGGDVALEDAIFLARGCEKVYLIHRRDALRGAAILQKRVMETPNIEVLWDSVVDEIQGEEHVEQLQVRNVKTGTKQALTVQGIFVAVGIQPNSEALKGFVDMDAQGYVIADESGKTSRRGVFAAGDVRTKMLRQIVTAASDGANSVTSVERYLTEL
ncbi:MAG: FAD-dependent oxidoreductase [bacterium]|nr:FAD-dependent oxidoreductase [bacterium]